MALNSAGIRVRSTTYIFGNKSETSEWTVHAITPDGRSELIGSYSSPAHAWRIIRILRQAAAPTSPNASHSE